jgi:transcriptional regulator with GAF, ATPase, and Fis domain
MGLWLIRINDMKKEKPLKIGNTKDLKVSIEELQKFKSMLYNVSAKFVSLPPDKIDREIEEALKLIVNFLDIDRADMWEIDKDTRKSLASYSYASPGVVALREVNAELLFPWAFERILNGTILKFSYVDKEIKQMTKDREFLIRQGIKSCLGIPLKISGSIVGVIAFISIKSYRMWTDEFIRDLSFVGEVFANALIRKRTHEEMEELLLFEHLVTEISAKYINLPTGKIDSSIEEDLCLGQVLGADMCVLVQFKHKNLKENLTHVWMGNGIETAPKIFSQDMFPWMITKWLDKDLVLFSDPDDLPEEAGIDKDNVLKIGVKSMLSVPLKSEGAVVGALMIFTVNTRRLWSTSLINRVQLLGEIFSNAILRKLREENLHSALNEIKALRKQVEEDCTYLRQEIAENQNFRNIIGQSDAVRYTLRLVELVAPTDTTVLITGETGSGKELIARAIHEMSARKKRPLVKVDCAVLSANLIESELFGHEKGAFTGAAEKREGRFELANKTTLFLDEIGEIPLNIQAKLLRLLQEGEFERLGSSKTLKVDVRIIAATNRNLELEVEKGHFRQDLWYRLNVFPINIPPLRARRGDISLLANHFAIKYVKKLGKNITRVPQDMIKKLERYQWPGNIRELENVIERAVVTSQGSKLQLADNSIRILTEGILSDQKGTLSAVEHDYIIKILEQTDWRVHGPDGAAQILGLNPSTLRSRIKKLRIKKTHR